jgi:hypothetical protein
MLKGRRGKLKEIRRNKRKNEMRDDAIYDDKMTNTIENGRDVGE